MDRLGARQAARGARSQTAATSERGRAVHSRRHVVSVVAAAGLLLLLSAPPPPATPDSAAGSEASPADAAAERADERAIARVLARWNPQLAAAERARIARAVTRYGAKYDLDPELVTAVIVVESEARPSARSPRGAMGLMQVMPQMLAPLRLAGNSMTVESNIEAGCRILSENIRRFGEEDGILAYFWGPNIRDGAYLQRVRAAREAVRRLLVSS
jgi:soluble lytic murein transglycosylase-like protein